MIRIPDEKGYGGHGKITPTKVKDNKIEREEDDSDSPAIIVREHAAAMTVVVN